jgi:crotonobetainyl-CoA:carnitine CoA-transferase CaiB-like acyl-CoA transferase
MAERVLRAYGLDHVLADPRFATNEARVRHAPDVDREVAAAVGARTLAENIEVIRAHELTAVPVQTVANLERDPHWSARQLLVDVDGTRMHVALPRLSATPGDVHHAGGALGRDTDSLLTGELGLPPATLADLRARGVI